MTVNLTIADAITMSQYLGRGAKSRGRMTINTGLSTVVSDVPYLKNEDDVEAVISGIENLREALSGVEGLTWLSPPADMSARDYVNDVSTLSLTFIKGAC